MSLHSQFSFQRPSSPVKFSDIEYLLAMHGHEIIVVAKESLNFWTCDREDCDETCSPRIYRIVFQRWLAIFLNLERQKGFGAQAAEVLASYGHIHKVACYPDISFATAFNPHYEFYAIP